MKPPPQLFKALATFLGLLCINTNASAQTPVYTTTVFDAITGDNSFIAEDDKRYWTIDSGADSYQIDTYERPTVQTYQVRTLDDSSELFAANEYYENLDIVSAQTGLDATYLYVSITMFGLDKSTEDGVDTFEGLKYRYGFRFSLEPDGANGYLFTTDDPLAKHGTSYGLVGNKGYQDTNGDVGGSGLLDGLTTTKEDDPAAAIGNGFDLQRVNDGEIINGANTGSEVLYARINPVDPTTVEFALNYTLLGFSMADMLNVSYFEFEAIKGDPEDPQNYLWNDEYNKGEAGSPYRATSGDLSKSEFGTQGLGNIYELDTLRGPSGIIIPEPTTVGLLIVSLVSAAFSRKRPVE